MLQEAHLASLKPHPAVERLLREVAQRSAVRSDRRSNYLSLRPEPIGAIGVYAFARRVLIAVEPLRARAACAAIPGLEAITRTPATTYIAVDASGLERAHEVVLEQATGAIAWRAAGPAMTLGARTSSRHAVEPDICPVGWMEITPSGACGCGCE